MSRRRDTTKGPGHLLDVFVPPDGAGEPVGCIATTYTFDAAFFEEECLTRFLSMETDAREQGAAYLIEREEKLQKAHISVVVDRAHAGGWERSLAWDLLSVRIPGRCMHAKVTLLVWSSAVRVVIGSANLSKPAYRSNLEVYGTLDFANGRGESVSLLDQVLTFLEGLARLAPERVPQQRTLDFLLGTRERTRGWEPTKRTRGEEPEVRVVFGGDIGRGAQSVLTTLREEVWPDSGPPRLAFVWSPFFDDDASKAANALMACLAQRGERQVILHLAATPEPGGRTKVQAPQSLVTALPNATIEPVVLLEDDELRMLHAKAYWLQSDRTVVYMLGSSNFTCAGLGVGGEPGNVEANLAYISSVDTSGTKALLACCPATSEGIDTEHLIFEPAFEEGQFGGLDEGTALPAGFVEAVVDMKDGTFIVTLRFDLPNLPARFIIAAAVDGEILLDSMSWTSRSGEVSVPWPQKKAPMALHVAWTDDTGAERTTLWLVNVRDRSLLPPPEALRDLSLETLLDILTMSRPLYEAVLRAVEREHADASSTALAELDPHRRVNTETFLLKRTKRFSRALETLRGQLEVPVAISDALRAKLRGPVGPFALADAVQRERPDPGEVAFLLAEIALCLGRVRVPDAPGCLSSDVVRGALRQAARDLAERVAPSLSQMGPEMEAYVTDAFAEAVR